MAAKVAAVATGTAATMDAGTATAMIAGTATAIAMGMVIMAMALAVQMVA